MVIELSPQLPGVRLVVPVPVGDAGEVAGRALALLLPEAVAGPRRVAETAHREGVDAHVLEVLVVAGVKPGVGELQVDGRDRVPASGTPPGSATRRVVFVGLVVLVVGTGDGGAQQDAGLVHGIGPEVEERFDHRRSLHQLRPAGVDHADVVWPCNHEYGAVADESAGLEARDLRDDDAVAHLHVVLVDERVDDADDVVA